MSMMMISSFQKVQGFNRIPFLVFRHSHPYASTCPAYARAIRSTHFRLFGTGSNRPSYRQRKRLRQEREEESTKELSWETFDFSTSPKWDTRFQAEGNRTIVTANTTAELEQIQHDEAQKDQDAAQQLHQHAQAWQRLDPDLVQRALAALRPFVQEDRVQRIEHVLGQRTRHTRFLFENPRNPSNVWACLRTMDSFGIQYVDIVVNSNEYKGPAALSHKRGMRTAMGSAQWITLRNHASTAEAIQSLKHEQGCVILASDLNPSSIDIRELDWSTILQPDTTTTTTSTSSTDRPVCIVMGSEETGISEEMRSLADYTFTLPMCGFAESFNLSVATAITLAHLSAASSSHDTAKGPLRPGDLHEREYQSLLLKGCLNSVAQKRMATALLKREGIELPADIKLL